MPASKVDTSVATFLQTSGHGTLKTNLFIGPEQEPNNIIPKACIFVLASGGPTPSRYMDGSTESFYQKDVQVIIRADRDDFDTGITLARAIMVSLQSGSITGYIRNHVINSEPTFIGFNDTEQPRWTINVRLWVVEN